LFTLSFAFAVVVKTGF